MKLKTFDELKESSITHLAWNAVINDIIDKFFIGTGYDFVANGESFNSLKSAIESILYNTRSTPEKHKCVNIDDYVIYNGPNIDDISKEYGFKDIKIATKVNIHGELYILVESKKLTKGFMKRFYKDPYFIAGKIIINLI